jgi:hypothetical protein
MNSLWRGPSTAVTSLAVIVLGAAACTLTAATPSSTQPGVLNCLRGTHQVSGACTPNQLRAVTYGAGKFVAVGDEGVIVTSSDGRTWNEPVSGSASNLLGVTFGGSQFAAVGAGGTILTSTDGTTWTSRTSSVPADLQAVAFGNGVFVAVGWSLTILTSTDGVTWTEAYSGTGVWQDVAFTGSEFVAVDRVGGVIVSPDTVHWTLAIAGNTASDTGLCAVTDGPGGDVLALDYSGHVKLSSNASSTTFAVEADLWAVLAVESCDVINDAGTLVATSTDGELVASSDGKTWSAVPGLNLGAAALRSLTFEGTHVVGVGAHGALLNATCSGGMCNSGAITTMEVAEPTVPVGSGGGTGSSSGGSTSGGGPCNSQQAMAACPDGTQRCCSVHMMCCRDTANGGAIGCEFAGFCQ